MHSQESSKAIRSHLARLFLVVSAILGLWIVLSTLTGAIGYRYPSLFWDQWDLFRSYLDYQSAGAFWNWLFVPHNGHRIVVTRLGFLFDFHATGASNLIPVLLMFFGQSLIVLCICLPAWQHLKTLQTKATVTFLVSALLFSATQLENFTWSFQTQFIGVFLFACLSFQQGDRYVNHPGNMAGAWALSWIFATLASFSMANGVLTWPILALAALLKRRWAFGISSLLVFAIMAVLYFLPVLQSDSPSHVPILGSIPNLDFFRFWLVYLSNPLGKTSLDLAVIFGFITLIVFVTQGVRSQVGDAKRNAPRHVGESLLWTAAFVVLTGLMTTIARVDRGLINATSERYTTGALLLIASLGVYLVLHRKRFWVSVWSRTLLMAWFTFATAYTGVLVSKQNFYLFHYGIQHHHKQIAFNAIQNRCLDDAFSIYLYPDLSRHLPALNTLITQGKSAAIHRLPDTIRITPSDALQPIEGLENRAILRSDFEGNPNKVVFYGSFPSERDLFRKRLFFTDSEGTVMGSGFGVRRLPDHEPFNQFEKQGSDQLFYAHGHSRLLQENSIVLVETRAGFESLGTMKPPFLEHQRFAPTLEFSDPNLSHTQLVDVTHSQHWTPGGVFPGSPESPFIAEFWGSWTRSDTHTGWIELVLEIPAGSTQILVPYLSGPSIPGAQIHFWVAGSPEYTQSFFLPASIERWRFIPFETPPAARQLYLRVEDDGSDWGQWVGIGIPFVR